MIPEEITIERESILERAVQYFTSKPGVLGIYLSGSLAEGSADAWSDIDLRVVVDAAHFDEVKSERHTAPRHWGHPLFNSGTMGDNMCVSHYEPFVKMDVFYYRPEDLKPSPWHTRPVKILLDRDGSIARMVENSRGLLSEPSVEQVNTNMNQSIACAHEVVRRAARGELAYAQAILGELRSLLIEADDWLHGRAPFGFSHLERREVSASLLDAIRDSHVLHTREDIMRALNTLVDFLEPQLQLMCEKWDLGRDVSNDRAALSIVKQVL